MKWSKDGTLLTGSTKRVSGPSSSEPRLTSLINLREFDDHFNSDSIEKFNVDNKCCPGMISLKTGTDLPVPI